MRVPVARDIDSPTDPDIVMLLNMIEKALQGRETARPSRNAAVQPYRHHLWRVGPLGVKRIEGVPQIPVELITAREAGDPGKAHVVVIQRIGDDEMRPAMIMCPIGEIIGIAVGIIEEAPFGNDQGAGLRTDTPCIPTQRPLAA